MLHKHPGQWQRGFLLALLTTTLWGVLPLALTIVLQALDAYTLTWFRFTLSFSLLSVLLLHQQQFPSLSRIYPKNWRLLLVATVFLGCNYFLFLQGLSLTSPGTVEVVIQLAPVLFGLGAILIFRERYILQQWAGLAVLIMGLMVFFHDKLGTLLTTQGLYLLGVGMIFLAALAWSGYALAQKQLLRSFSSSQIMVLIYGGCMVLFLPKVDFASFLTLTPLQGGLLLFCGLNTLIAYGSFAESLNHWYASKISAVLSTAPLITLASVEVAALVIPQYIASEQITLLGVFGAVCVVSGSMSIALFGNR
ncbi:DMT family transporter [Spirulina sp. CS-785/01]|uniref:DMT family transporter n=1 Tax=Spirulina sp. CS-785/01 TaxID=3021716 RepID=UPI002330A7E2|nr:DMT family transporter [Spirulina sp. CS-785/01]MDB9311824.1 DMT family transporter [Spirulina sp. CS-785/01]